MPFFYVIQIYLFLVFYDCSLILHCLFCIFYLYFFIFILHVFFSLFWFSVLNFSLLSTPYLWGSIYIVIKKKLLSHGYSWKCIRRSNLEQCQSNQHSQHVSSVVKIMKPIIMNHNLASISTFENVFIDFIEVNQSCF